MPIVNLLLKQGARVNFEESYNKPTPLDLAILKGDLEMVRLMLDSGEFSHPYIHPLDLNFFAKYILL